MLLEMLTSRWDVKPRYWSLNSPWHFSQREGFHPQCHWPGSNYGNYLNAADPEENQVNNVKKLTLSVVQPSWKQVVLEIFQTKSYLSWNFKASLLRWTEEDCLTLIRFREAPTFWILSQTIRDKEYRQRHDSLVVRVLASDLRGLVLCSATDFLSDSGCSLLAPRIIGPIYKMGIIAFPYLAWVSWG